MAAGTRAYSIGFEDGRFYANGWHITGEMGGIWAPPLKLADGIWFGIDDEWVGPATKFTSGRGYIRYALPPMHGLLLRRTDFVPDGRRAALFGLELANPTAAAKTVTVKVDVHSELIGAYPWASTTPTARRQPRRHRGLRRTAGSTFTRPRHAPRRPGPRLHGARRLHPRARRRRDRPGLPRPAARRGLQGRRQVAAERLRRRPVRQGRGRPAALQRHASPRAPRRPSGSRSPAPTAASPPRASELAAALARPGRAARGQDRRARRARRALEASTSPATASCRRRSTGASRTSPTSRRPRRTCRSASSTRARRTRAPVDNVKRATFIGAGYPDYPWLFATDGEYTAFAAVALGQFEAIKDHLSALRDVSDDAQRELAARSRTRSSPTARSTSAPTPTRATPTSRPSSRPPSRWSGAGRATTASATGSTTSPRATCSYVTGKLDADKDGWPEGLGNVERDRHGRGEARQRRLPDPRRSTTSPTWRAAKRRPRDAKWATGLADKLRATLRRHLVGRGVSQYADSLEAGDAASSSSTGSASTPMEAELTLDGRAVPGLAAAEHAPTALAEREDDCFSGSRPVQPRPLPHRLRGRPGGQGRADVFSLTTVDPAVGEGNYGRLGDEQQRRYTDANALPMLEPDEQPGALPEILPSPGPGRQHRPLLDVPLDVHAGLGPLRHRVAGDPPAARRAAVARHAASSRSCRRSPRARRASAAGHPARRRRRRRRARSAAAAATRRPRPSTAIEGSTDLRVGATLPAGEEAKTVTLDGTKVEQADRARDQPRRRGDASRCRRPGKHVVVVTFVARPSRGSEIAVARSREDAMRWRRTLTLSALLATVPAVAQADAELSVQDRLRGPAGGGRGHAGVLGRLPGRPLLRQRLAHHRRDGRHLGAAAEARRRHLVRRRRRVGRRGDEVHAAGAATSATTCRPPRG